jgi:hypothetical protein
MFRITRKRPVATLALVAGLLVAAAPANAGIAIGNPPGHPARMVPKDTAQILSMDHEI